MVQDIIQFTRLADISPARRGNLLLWLSAGKIRLVVFTSYILNIVEIVFIETRDMCFSSAYRLPLWHKECTYIILISFDPMEL